MQRRKRLVFIAFILPIVIIVGIIGYRVIEGWSYFDAVYMTVITLSTVGYSEVHPLSSGGRIFTMFFVLSGMGVVFYGVTAVAAFLIEGDLKDLLRRRRMDKTISDLVGHYIICGMGNTGWYVVEEMSKTRNRFVVIDIDPTRFRSLPWQGLLFIDGDATKDIILQSAGIKGAKGLITLLPSDKDNLFVVLTAKGLNPRLKIVTKGVGEESRQKFLKAGADSVVFPHFIGGMRIASEILRPTMMTFFDSILLEQGRNIRIEETVIQADSTLIGLTLAEARLPEKTGLLVLAIRDAQNGYRFNPPHTTSLRGGDTLVICGEEEQIQRLRLLCSSSKGARSAA
jgi:voltage-gated potassium channel